jgi:hypothetical protein
MALSLTACTPVQIVYLREAVNQATQDEITTTLGPPQTSACNWENGVAV